MSVSEDLILDVIKLDNDRMIRIWVYKDAPKVLQELIPDDHLRAQARCIVIVPEASMEVEWLGDILYNSYVDPEWFQFGDYNVYVVYD